MTTTFKIGGESKASATAGRARQSSARRSLACGGAQRTDAPNLLPRTDYGSERPRTATVAERSTFNIQGSRFKVQGCRFLLCLVALWTVDCGLWTCSAQRPSYDTFKLIAERNIFNQSRRGARIRSSYQETRRTRFEAVTLAGTMSYEKGTFAFFEGTSSDYTKAVKAADKIAGYEVKEVAPNFVKLASSTNEIELRVGMQLRREEGGEWHVTEA